jgi:hypothetical protein
MIWVFTRKALWSMDIRFNQQEIALLKNYFNRIDSGETQKQLRGLHQEFPEWNTVFLLLRKLLAYGVYYTVPTNTETGYDDLQKRSQKPDTMLDTVHTHFDQFNQLLASYTAHHLT